MTQVEAEPKLQPPGAGLPPLERFISNLAFKRVLPLFVSRQGATRWFRAEADRILGMVRGLEPVRGAKRVLIPRHRGLEDSSRYWSVYMTLEHLVIVNTGLLGIVPALAAGKTIDHVVSTADVKPLPTADATSVERFEAVVNRYLATVDAIPDLRSKARHLHPWFGPLTAIQWHRLAALHQRIHSKQIEQILRLLPPE